MDNHMNVYVWVKNGDRAEVHVELVVGEFNEWCARIFRSGLHTSTEDGLLSIPPHNIERVTSWLPE